MLRSLPIWIAALLATPSMADNTELNALLEDNATAAAFARLCGDEPLSDLLKANTMLLLAFNGIGAQQIQLGSAKFNDILRREIRAKRAPTELNCAQRQAQATSNLDATRAAIARARAN